MTHRDTAARRCSRIHAHARGAALTEFAVLMVALIPLMFGIPMIGKLIDMKQTAVQASRYVAWESTVDARDAAPVNVSTRFFRDPSAPLASTPAEVESHVLWGPDESPPERGPMADTYVAIDETSAAALPYGSAYGGANGVSEGVAHEIGTLVERVGGLIDDQTNGDWAVTGDGMLRAGVHVDVEANGWMEASSLDETTVIMSDGWSSPNDRAAATRTRSFVPAGALDELGVGDAISLAGTLPIFKELKSFKDDDGNSAFGFVDMQPLPPSERAQRPLLPFEEVE